MTFRKSFPYSGRTARVGTVVLLLFLAVAAVLWPMNGVGQQPPIPKLTLSQVQDLISHNVPDSTMSTQIQLRGLTFASNPAIIESLRAKGAGPLTLAAIVEYSSKEPKPESVRRPQAAPSSPRVDAPGNSTENARTSEKVNIAADVAVGLLLQKTNPIYPPIAKAARISGTVVLQATISKAGLIESLRVVTGPAMLQGAALDAVKTWRYRPFLVAGKPVEVETTINVIFTLGDGPSTQPASAAPVSNFTQNAETAKNQLTLGGRFNKPTLIALDRDGNVFVTEQGTDLNQMVTLKMIPIEGGYSTVRTLRGFQNATFGIAVDESSNVLLVGPGFNEVNETLAASQYNSDTWLLRADPYAVAITVDRNGNVFVAEFSGSVVEIPSGCTSVSCVRALGNGFNSPSGIAVDENGNVVIDEFVGSIKEIPSGCTSAGCIKTLNSSFHYSRGVAVDGSGNIFVADTENNAVKEIPPGCVSASCVRILGSGFNSPWGIATDRSGNVFVADSGNNRVVELKISKSNASQGVATKPVDSGPTLAATLQFIQDKLSQQGQVAYLTTLTFLNKPGVTIRQNFRGLDDKVVLDPATCTLHDSGTMDQTSETSSGGKTVATDEQHSEMAGSFSFKDVEKVNVVSIENLTRLQLLQNHHPELTATVEPPVFAVELSAAKSLFSIHESATKRGEVPKVADKTDKEVVFIFRDEEMANRVAKAIRHAVELCDDVNTEPF